MKTVFNDLFDHAKGLLIDNAYDLYTLNSYIKYCKTNSIKFLKSQDNDLSYLKYFKDVLFLSIPQEAYNFDELNMLSNLVGLSMYSSSLEYINKDIVKKLQYLDIIFDTETAVNFSNFESLKNLRIINYPFSYLNIKNDLDYFELNYCKKISNFEGLSKMRALKKIKLFYLPNLTHIDYLKNFSKSLESVEFIDCKKISDFEATMQCLNMLKCINIFTESNDKSMSIKSLDFIDNINSLEEFSTNYKIEDGNLTKLLNLKNVNLTSFYKNYNLNDKDLPHYDVLINVKGIVKRMDLKDIPAGKEDPRIIWMK